MSTTNTALNEPLNNSSGWDIPLNNNFTIIDGYFAQTASISITTANVTLTGPTATPNSSSLGNTQNMLISLTGTLTGNRYLIFPAGIKGRWTIKNNTGNVSTTPYTVTLTTSVSPPGAYNNIVAPQGYSVTVYSDGSNIYFDNDGLTQLGGAGSFTTITTTGNATIGGNSTIAGNETISGKLIAQGAAATLGALVNNISETATIVASGATGTINFDITTQSVLYYTSNSTANFTLNIRGNSTNTLDSLLGVGQAATVVFMNTNGTTAYYMNSFKIDGTSITPKWIGGVAPTSGYTNSIDTYSFTIIKTAAATYTVAATITKFA
jgi:hypothetical protein